MADNTNEHSEQIIGLTELMVETLQATIDADRSTAEEYYRILEENSFIPGEDGAPAELQMVDVRIQNSNGQTQVISVPKMVLMPVPMLHISEANFEIGGNMCLNTEGTVTETSTGNGVRTQPERVTTPKKGVSEEVLRKNPSIIRRNSSLQVQLVKKTTNETSTENAQSSTNLKISVKLTQSDMPSGLVNLLQVISNNIQVKNE